MTGKEIIIFTQAGWPPCDTAKAYLSERGLRFTERDVRSDFSAVRELVEKYQSRSTPTIVIAGQVMIGFDPQRLEEMLAE